MYKINMKKFQRSRWKYFLLLCLPFCHLAVNNNFFLCCCCAWYLSFLELITSYISFIKHRKLLLIIIQISLFCYIVECMLMFCWTVTTSFWLHCPFFIIMNWELMTLYDVSIASCLTWIIALSRKTPCLTTQHSSWV